MPADSTAGLVTYEDKFSYSHHATDPACGILCNAFDLVRLHKFRELDADVPEGTAPSKLPSYKGMQELCINDEGVKKQLAKERMAQAKADAADTDDDWQAGLQLNKNGEIKDTLSNIVSIIRHDRNLQGIAYNRHRDGIDVKGSLPWKQVKEGWNDSDNAGIKVYFDHTYHIWGSTKVKEALIAVASQRAYHPVKEYLNSLPQWDGIERVDKLIVDYLGAEAMERYRAGEELYLKGQDTAMAIAEQSRAMESDDREGLVRLYLDKLLPENWNTMDLYQRRSFLSGGDIGDEVVGTVKQDRVCTMEIWCECFAREPGNMRKTDACELNAIMAKVEGWKRYEANKRGVIKFRIYGPQNGYVRVVD